MALRGSVSGSYSLARVNVCECFEIFPEDHADPFRAT